MEERFASEFEGTPYEDTSWEVVGQRIKNDTFESLQVEIVNREVAAADPLFEDYGGKTPPKAKQRFHLPEDQAFIGEDHAQKEDLTAKFKLREAELLAQVEVARKEGFEQGRAKAYEEAADKNAARINELQGKLNAILAEMQKQVRTRVQKIETDAIDLALAIGKKIFGSAVEVNPEYILPLLQEALGLRGGAIIKSVRVSLPDFEFIQVIGIAPRLKDFDGTWGFVADPAIKSGCVVETSAGEIDFQLDAAWERIQDAVVKSVRSA